MNISFEYLQNLLQEANALREIIEYQELNDTDYDEITYILKIRDTIVC